jgi:hypothetical protein
MERLQESPLTTAFIAAVGALGCGALVYSIVALPDRPDAVMVVTLMLIAAFAQRAPIALFRSSSISVAFAATIACYMLYGPGLAIWVNLTSAVVNSFTPKPKPTRKIIFNLGSFTISAFVAANVYIFAGGSVPPEDMLRSLLAALVSAVAYFVCGSVLTATIVSLTTDDSVVRVWRANYSWLPLHYLGVAVNGAALALAYQALGLVGALTFVLPLGLAWYSLRLYMARSTEVRARVADLSEENRVLQLANERLEQARLISLVTLLGELRNEKPDLDHLAATYPAIAVARDMQLSDEEVSAVHLGTLLHDIGKIVVPEDVLTKRDGLTEDEWSRIRMHPAVGADLVGRVPLLRKIRPIVLAHHERYDGSGYPSGLAGNEIPLGARIIAVADAYEAMTSTRPYREARLGTDALHELRASAGTQFDPEIVERFADVIERKARLATTPDSVPATAST